MSTINKTFLRVLLAIACCIALAFSLLPQAEAAMRADVVTGKVTLNGQVIDNKNAKYPLLSYSNITYFPMTYQLSRFMGVETDWNNAAKSLNITAGGAQSAYVAEPGKAPRGSVSVTLPSYRISVNGALIDNKEATYPIFNYNGVTYFPLTFRYAYESFGWGYGNMGADSHVCKRWFYRLHRECKRRYSKERRNADRDPHDELHPDHDARVTGFPSPPRRKKRRTSRNA